MSVRIISSIVASAVYRTIHAYSNNTMCAQFLFSSAFLSPPYQRGVHGRTLMTACTSILFRNEITGALADYASDAAS